MLITSFASPFAGSNSSKNTSPPQETQATPTRAEASQNQPAETQPTQQTRSQETSSSQPVEASRSTSASPSSDDQPASASASATPSGEPAQSASTSPEPAANMDRMARAVQQRNVDTPAATIATQDRQTILSSQALEAEEIQARNAAENQLRTEQLLSLATENYSLTQNLFRSDTEVPEDPQPNPAVIRDPKPD
ncbi:hypothetical protein EOJ32_17540 (plasmid) [Paracoccus sp. Arc7-R13]|uniref:hypothetical protein n=1 Tax=Paracoccus sp. Arc7-R13 TaxID=2500532 RepID=UPI000FDAF99F|nr:hypothetical protein [Paracoccus sp. Arc7-R13]AZY95593.1 hypothetical protein EOJ32_17540 [Paracoccus sp. Arc7-R13]